MTAQIKETLIFQGETCAMASEPLYPWLNRRRNKKIQFRRPHTACSRGYVGTWEIIDDRLHLVKIRAKFLDEREVELHDLFPESPLPVFANWFDGELRCPSGKLLGYVHSGYSSIHERDLFLKFKAGILIEQRTITNETPPTAEEHEKPMLEKKYPELKS